MRTKIGLVCCLLVGGLVSGVAFADDFVNGGFETGTPSNPTVTISGWSQGGGRFTTAGTPIDPDPFQLGGASYNSSYITNSIVGNGYDPVLAAEGINISMAYRGNQAVRVNDINNNQSISTVSQTVSNYGSSTINFAWFAVLQGAGHAAADSDNFTIKIKDNTTNAVVKFISYNAAATGGTFNSVNTSAYGTVYYSGWKAESVAVTRGDSYTITLLASDCDAGGHWGYVYLDGFGLVAVDAPPGPSTADTQVSLVSSASALQNTFTLQNAVLANSFTYDCSLFDKNNICVSAGGRNTAVQAANGLNNTSALLIAAYRPHPNYRVGAYADQNLSVNNAGSTVNLGNNTPLIGVFGVWHDRRDDTGAEVKVSAAYGQKNTTVNRQVVGTSEAGVGSSQLNSQGAQMTAKYGFGVIDNVIVSPYVGVRYTQNNMGGYTEGASTNVTAPLSYNALNTNATTALAGVVASFRGIPKTNLFASAGVESDTNTSNGSYSATGVSGLTPVNFNATPVKTRPTATIGATYDVEKNQRLGVTGIYRQEAYQAVSTTTVMATYTVGF